MKIFGKSVKIKMLDNMPDTFDKAELSAIRSDLEEATTVKRAMELYLVAFGKDNFERIFPLKQNRRRRL